MRVLLNRQELCEAFGVSDSTITAWEKEGMPVVRKGRGRGMKSVYDYDQVKRWCDANGRGIRMASLINRTAPASSSPAPSSSPQLLAKVLLAGARRWLESEDQAGDLPCAPGELAELADNFLFCCAESLETVQAGVHGAMCRLLDSEPEFPTSMPAAMARIARLEARG